MKILFSLLLSLVVFSANAQNMQEEVHLKNGSIIKGIVIEQVPDSVLKLKTSDGSLFVYKMSEVQKIVKIPVEGVQRPSRPYTYSQPQQARSRRFSYKDEEEDDDEDEEEDEEDDNNSNGNGLSKGVRFIIETGYQFGLSKDDYDSECTNFSVGMQISKHIYVGGGVGVRFYSSDSGNTGTFAMPIFANFRYDILNFKATPFLDVKMGYNPFDLSGLYWSSGVGCRFRLGNKFGLSVSMGIEMQDYDYYNGYGYYGYTSYNETASNTDLFIRLGVEF